MRQMCQAASESKLPLRMRLFGEPYLRRATMVLLITKDSDLEVCLYVPCTCPFVPVPIKRASRKRCLVGGQIGLKQQGHCQVTFDMRITFPVGTAIPCPKALRRSSSHLSAAPQMKRENVDVLVTCPVTCQKMGPPFWEKKTGEEKKTKIKEKRKRRRRRRKTEPTDLSHWAPYPLLGPRQAAEEGPRSKPTQTRRSWMSVFGCLSKIGVALTS